MWVFSLKIFGVSVSTKCEEPWPSVFFSEALQEIKHEYFTGNGKTGFEPSFGITSVTDGTAFSVRHLFVATVYNAGPAPNIFSSLIYNYIIGDISHLKEEVPQELLGSIFEDLHKQVGAEQLYCCLYSFGTENVRLLSFR